MHLITFTPHAPYAWDILLDFLRRHAYPVLDIPQGNAYRRMLSTATGMALVEVTFQGTPTAPRLSVALLAQQGAPAHADLIAQLQHILALEADRAAFFAYAAQHDPLAKMTVSLVGLPVLRSATVFEALVNVIIEQQIAWKAALRAQNWLLQWGGRSIEYDGQRYYAYPTAAQLAAATLEDLKPLKITHKRIEMLRRIAGEVVAGTLDLEILRDDPQQGYQRLRQIKGIGHWTAAVVMERASGQYHWITENDVALQAAVGRYFYAGVRATPAQVLAAFAPYGEQGGIAAFYTLARWVQQEYPHSES